MKKQKFMKLSAFTSDPDLGNSFSAPATHDGEVSVVFRGKDVSIHGWDGSTWTTIYTWNSLDKQFTFDNTYQNYFLKSLTGSQETMGVSFFSTSRYQGSTPSMAGIDRDVKLHDIDEVPVYTASDVNKMLTIMSDGSLAWLLASESFTVEGGESSSSQGLEEDSGLTLHGNAQLIDGVLTLDGTNGTYASLPHSTDYDRESGDLTVDFWFNADSLPAANSNYILMSKPTGAHDWNGWVIAYSTQRQDQGNSGPLMTDGGIGVYASSQTAGGADAQPNNFRATVVGGVAANTWHHVAVTMPASGDYTIYLNGQSIGSWLPPYKNDSTNTELLFGATKGVGELVKFFPGELDQVSINKSILTAGEIQAIYDNGPESVESEGGEAPAGPIAWDSDFTVVSPGSFYEDEPGGQAMRTGDGGFAHARWDSFLSADDPDQAIASFWFKANDNLISATSRKLFGSFSGYKGVKIQIQGDGTGNEILKSSYSKSSSVSGLTSKSYTTNFSKDVWYNVVMTLDKIAGTAKTYLNGVMVSEFTGVESTANWVPDFNGSFGLGSDKTNSDNNATYESYDFDSFQMVEGYTLTDSQIASIYNDGSNRDVVIASNM